MFYNIHILSYVAVVTAKTAAIRQIKCKYVYDLIILQDLTFKSTNYIMTNNPFFSISVVTNHAHTCVLCTYIKLVCSAWQCPSSDIHIPKSINYKKDVLKIIFSTENAIKNIGHNTVCMYVYRTTYYIKDWFNITLLNNNFKTKIIWPDQKYVQYVRQKIYNTRVY